MSFSEVSSKDYRNSISFTSPLDSPREPTAETPREKLIEKLTNYSGSLRDKAQDLHKKGIDIGDKTFGLALITGGISLLAAPVFIKEYMNVRKERKEVKKEIIQEHAFITRALKNAQSLGLTSFETTKLKQMQNSCKYSMKESLGDKNAFTEMENTEKSKKLSIVTEEFSKELELLTGYSKNNEGVSLNVKNFHAKCDQFIAKAQPQKRTPIASFGRILVLPFAYLHESMQKANTLAQLQDLQTMTHHMISQYDNNKDSLLLTNEDRENLLAASNKLHDAIKHGSYENPDKHTTKETTRSTRNTQASQARIKEGILSKGIVSDKFMIDCRLLMSRYKTLIS